MSEVHFTFQSGMPIDASRLNGILARDAMTYRMLPPWRKAVVLDQTNTLLKLRVQWGLLSFLWQFDRKKGEFSQSKGPFRHFSHHFRAIPRTAHESTLEDDLRFSHNLPFCTKNIDAELSHFLSWRHAVLREDIALIHRHPTKPLRILLSGSTGLIGSQLKTFLQLAGHTVIPLMRGKHPSTPHIIYWDPASEQLTKDDFEGFDAVIHLAGESIASGRWTKNRKERLFVSRCRDSWLLSQVLSRLDQPPKTVLCASAIGYYGDRGIETLTEDSSSGQGFLPNLCIKWESAMQSVASKGTRVVHARFGIVLSAHGGALKTMIPPFKWGLGGKFGPGTQMMSWIALDDVIGALYHSLMTESIDGPINVVAPHSLTQAEFAKKLAKRLQRPAFLSLPTWALHLALGEMADALLLASCKAVPEKLLKTGYEFRYPDLETALHYVL